MPSPYDEAIQDALKAIDWAVHWYESNPEKIVGDAVAAFLEHWPRVRWCERHNSPQALWRQDLPLLGVCEKVAGHPSMDPVTDGCLFGFVRVVPDE